MYQNYRAVALLQIAYKILAAYIKNKLMKETENEVVFRVASGKKEVQ